MIANNNTVTTKMNMNNILCGPQTSTHGPTPQQQLPVKPTLFQRLFSKQQHPVTNIQEQQSQPQFTQQRRVAKQQPFVPQQKQSSYHQQLPVSQQSPAIIITANSHTTLPMYKLPSIGEFLFRNQTRYKLASSPTWCNFSGSEVYTSHTSDGRYGSICPGTNEVPHEYDLQVPGQTSLKRKVSAITTELTEEPRVVKQKRQQNLRQKHYRERKKAKMENYANEEKRLLSDVGSLETTLEQLQSQNIKPSQGPEVFTKLSAEDQAFLEEQQHDAWLPDASVMDECNEVEKLRITKAVLATKQVFQRAHEALAQRDHPIWMDLFEPNAEIAVNNKTIAPQNIHEMLNRPGNVMDLMDITVTKVGEDCECLRTIATARLVSDTVWGRQDSILNISFLWTLKTNRIDSVCLTAVDEATEKNNRMLSMFKQ